MGARRVSTRRSAASYTQAQSRSDCARIAEITYWQFYFRFFPGAIRSPQIVEFLKVLRRQIPGKLLIIWDGLRAHRSYMVRDYAEQQGGDIQLEFLPAYAPELNPVEGAWSWFKRTVVGNFCPEGHGPLHRILRLARRRLTRQRPLLLGFLHKSGLSLP